MVGEVTGFLTGWMSYFRYAQAEHDMVGLGKWVRRKLRCARLCQCKHSLGIRNFLIGQGVSQRKAFRLCASGKGWWRLAAAPPAHEAMPNHRFGKLGLIDPLH
jgi:RNA-directed DNA polymerase